MTAATHLIGRRLGGSLAGAGTRPQLRPWVAVVGSISWTLFLGRIAWMALGG